MHTCTLACQLKGTHLFLNTQPPQTKTYSRTYKHTYTVITITLGCTSFIVTRTPFEPVSGLFSSQMIAINSLQSLLDRKLTTFYIVDTLLTQATCSQLQIERQLAAWLQIVLAVQIMSTTFPKLRWIQAEAVLYSCLLCSPLPLIFSCQSATFFAIVKEMVNQASMLAQGHLDQLTSSSVSRACH